MRLPTLLVLALCSLGAVALRVVAPAPVRTASAPARPPARAAPRAAAVAMQLTEAPVKIPDFAPNFATGKPSGDQAPKNAPKFKLLLFNDNVNRREYVAKVLVAHIPGMKQANAYQVMQQAHQNGMAVVGVWTFEVAEMYCEELKAGGLIASVTEEGKDD